MPEAISTGWIVGALIAFLIKHLFADFFLQTTWMANGKEQARGWFWPLTVHVAIHGAATGLIFAFSAPDYIAMALVDFVIHFAIDRTKGIAGRALNADPSKTSFWWLIGIDQTLHHLTHLGFALLIAVVRS